MALCGKTCCNVVVPHFRNVNLDAHFAVTLQNSFRELRLSNVIEIYRRDMIIMQLIAIKKLKHSLKIVNCFIRREINCIINVTI